MSKASISKAWRDHTKSHISANAQVLLLDLVEKRLSDFLKQVHSVLPKGRKTLTPEAVSTVWENMGIPLTQKKGPMKHMTVTRQLQKHSLHAGKPVRQALYAIANSLAYDTFKKLDELLKLLNRKTLKPKTINALKKQLHH